MSAWCWRAWRSNVPGERLRKRSRATHRARARGRRVAGSTARCRRTFLCADDRPARDGCTGSRALLSRTGAHEARARSSIPATAFLTVHRGWFSCGAGDCQRRGGRTHRTRSADRSRHPARKPVRIGAAARSLDRDRTDRDAAEALRTSGLDTEIPPGLANNTLFEARGLLRLAQGNARAGLDDLLEFDRRDQLWGAANPLASRWRSHACLALRSVGR